MPRRKKKKKKKKEAARQATLSRISDSRSIEAGLHHRFRLGSKSGSSRFVLQGRAACWSADIKGLPRSDLSVITDTRRGPVEEQ